MDGNMGERRAYLDKLIALRDHSRGKQGSCFVVTKASGDREYHQVAYAATDEKTLNRELSSLRTLCDLHPEYLLTMDFDRSNIGGV